MTTLDLVIRGGTVATATDIMQCDLGIGEVVYQQGQFTAAAGRCQFLPCDRPACAKPYRRDRPVV